MEIKQLVSAWLRNVQMSSSRLKLLSIRTYEMCCVSNDFEKDRVIFNVRSSQWRQRQKTWASGGNIHFRLRPVEGRAAWIGAEGFNDVTWARLVLIEERECDFELERPLKQWVEFASHDDEENRQVAAFSNAVPIGVQPGAHFVSTRTCVEGRWVKRHHLAGDRFLPATLEICHLPNENATCCLQLVQVLANVYLTQLNVMKSHSSRISEQKQKSISNE